MQKILAFSVILMLLIFGACSEKKTDDEYFTEGYDKYNAEKYQEALVSFGHIIEDYPDSEFTAKAMFMMGFINANHIKNFDEAKKYYTMFIEKYPSHELVDSAKYELETLGKDIEDLPIFQKIEENEGKPDSTI